MNGLFNKPFRQQEVSAAVGGYFSGLEAAARGFPTSRLSSLVDTLRTVQQQRGRVFTMGNGGSLANAQVVAKVLKQAGMDASLATSADLFDLSSMDSARVYDKLFLHPLQQVGLCERDCLIGISGSGNSPNILLPFEEAKQHGTKLIGLGGRDGGRMAELTGDHCYLFTTEIMEQIEDLNLLAAEIAAQAIETGAEPATLWEQVCDNIAKWAEANSQKLAELGFAVLRTAWNESCTFILGADVGSRHFRADAGRGFSNAIPIRGFCAPEFFSDNGGTALINDDGPAYLLVDGLVKYLRAGDAPVAVVIDLPQTKWFLPAVLEELERHQITPHVVGNKPEQIDASALLEMLSLEFIMSSLGHLFGSSLRSVLWQGFEPRELGELALDLRGQRKPLYRELLAHEEALRAAETIGDDEVVSYAYGKAYAVKNPELFGLRRVHY
jgi:D-sedoheptulose 7-phosphate isomerase